MERIRTSNVSPGSDPLAQKPCRSARRKCLIRPCRFEQIQVPGIRCLWAASQSSDPFRNSSHEPDYRRDCRDPKTSGQIVFAGMAKVSFRRPCVNLHSSPAAQNWPALGQPVMPIGRGLGGCVVTLIVGCIKGNSSLGLPHGDLPGPGIFLCHAIDLARFSLSEQQSQLWPGL
jgi:hypothetical protein